MQTKVKLPRKWADFLFVDENKSELFQYLASETSQHKFRENKQIVITKGAEVLTVNSHKMSDSTHEEADSRLFLHIMEALEEGNNCIMIRTVDTDVVVICMGKFHDVLARYPDFHLWIRFGTGNSVKTIYLNTVCATAGKDISRGLPFFHALTGCDTTSAFKGKGKKSAWQAWKGSPAVTHIFEHLSQNPFKDVELGSIEFKELQKFTVHMY